MPALERNQPDADRASIQRWFTTHGVPNFIDGYTHPRRVLARAGWFAGLAAAVTLASAVIDAGDVGAGFVVLVTVLVALAVLILAYLVIASGLIPLSLFGLVWLGRTLLRGGARVLTVLPLLLVALTFLFLGAETWQSIGRLRGLPLVLTALLFVALGARFVSRQVRPDLDAVVSFDDPEALRAALPRELRWSEEQIAGGLSGGSVRYGDDTELTRLERTNLRAVTTIAQLTVAVVVGLSIFAFFLVFGVLVVGYDTAKAWSTSAPVIWWQATIFGHHYVLTAAHARVSGFLGVFSAFYFVVSASADQALRETLSEGAQDHVQTCLAVRAVYRSLG